MTPVSTSSKVKVNIERYPLKQLQQARRDLDARKATGAPSRPCERDAAAST
ncbi:MAG TPA: hypothetical protein PLB25_03115 [Rhodoferax sp.]|nr:hypothetical protein [Rhodoferax sp.]